MRKLASYELFGRTERDEHQNAGTLLLDGNTLLNDFLRQARLCRRNPVLGEDVRHVLVRSDLKVDIQQAAAVARVRGLHVDEALDAVDFLFDGGRHRLFDRLGGCAGIGGGHADVRRGEKRVLLHRQPGDGYAPEHDGQDRYDDGDDGPADKEVWHMGPFLFTSPLAVGFSVGVTVIPGRTFCIPSVMTRSPGLTSLFDYGQILIPFSENHRAEGHLVATPPRHKPSWRSAAPSPPAAG